jgi:enoyl-CoA hydratase/carnithine racemase
MRRPLIAYRSGVQYEEIRVDDDDHVRLITLDRPARRNAMSWRMLAELADAMAAADDDEVYIVVLTGAPPAFCAGTDMSADGHAWQAPADGGRRDPNDAGQSARVSLSASSIASAAES